MNKITELKQRFTRLLDDVDFDRIGLELQKPNIFQILGVTRTEIRHSNFLAWLLDANANHSLGNQVVSRFLRSVLADQRVQGIDESDIEDLDFASMCVHREWHHIDILLEFPDLIICIENKVDSGEHTQQLTRYRELVGKRFPDRRFAFVYLTPTGAASTQESQFYVEYSYQQLIEVLERILMVYKQRLAALVASYLEDYMTTIKREILENDELNQLASKLYRNHQEILDFLFQHRPDRASEIGMHVYRMLEKQHMVRASPNKGYARFLPQQLDKVIPRTGTGYAHKEAFMFELDFYWPNQDKQKKITFRTIIAPGNEEVRAVLKECLKGVQKAKTPAGQKFVVHFLESYPFNLEEIQQQGEEDLALTMDKIWQQIKGTVEAVTAAILAREDDLLALRSQLEKPLLPSGASQV